VLAALGRPARPAELHTRSAHVATFLRQMILDGELRPGDRVRQEAIAEQLGVSRIPVREAIIALEGEGWLTSRHNQGAYVVGLDRAMVRDHYELLGIVYGLVARRASERADDAAVKELAALQRALSGESEAEAVDVVNDAYLRQLTRMADAVRVTALLRVMSGLIPGNFFAAVPGAIDNQKRGTTAITRAVRARDGDAAARACHRMLMAQGGSVSELLAERNVLHPRGA
jgi:DNA-binding GntR family transcriptional regulator